MKEKKHLPLYGPGPYILIGQAAITAAAVAFVVNSDFEFAHIPALDIPFLVLGAVLVVLGFYMNYSAKKNSKLFENVKENKLITNGIYSIVRNPVYSAVLIICTGFAIMINNLLLFAVPVICWIFTSIVLVFTEEKWLKNLYGEEYTEYCKNVNRLIPWFPKKK